MSKELEEGRKRAMWVSEGSLSPRETLSQALRWRQPDALKECTVARVARVEGANRRLREMRLQRCRVARPCRLLWAFVKPWLLL